MIKIKPLTIVGGFLISKGGNNLKLFMLKLKEKTRN